MITFYFHVHMLTLSTYAAPHPVGPVWTSMPHFCHHVKGFYRLLLLHCPLPSGVLSTPYPYYCLCVYSSKPCMSFLLKLITYNIMQIVYGLNKIPSGNDELSFDATVYLPVHNHFLKWLTNIQNSNHLPQLERKRNEWWCLGQLAQFLFLVSSVLTNYYYYY